MELTQQEIQWVKDRVAEEQALLLALAKDKQIEEARLAVAEQYQEQLKACKTPEERAVVIETITTKANEAQALVE